jgi:peptidase M48-like protein
LKSLVPRISVFLLAVLLATATNAEIYIRNKAVPSQQQKAYISTESLANYFTKEELERCQFNLETGQITVDGKVLEDKLGQDPENNVPVVALALALGFQKRVNNELGVVDYVAPSTLEGPKSRADTPKRKGPEYNAAAARMKKVLSQSPQIADHPEQERVQRIGGELVEVSDMPGLQWNILIVSESTPNAFCTGVGWVAVTDGLLALNLTDDELAGVLAHEIGHGCRRDLEENRYNVGVAQEAGNEALALDAQRQQMVTRQKELYARAARARDLGLPDEADKASREANALSRPIKNLEREIQQKVKRFEDHKDFATGSQFKHQDEIDADKKGIRYATTAGYSADGLMSALVKLADKNAKTFGQAAYQGGQSHPSLVTRINTIKKVLADWRR